jgi:hypothetical protein
VSLSAFAFLFSELVQYCQQRVSRVTELENRLEQVGFRVGERVLELCCYREKVRQNPNRFRPARTIRPDAPVSTCDDVIGATLI